MKIKLKGDGAGAASDKLAVKAPDSVAGEQVKFFRVEVGGKLKLKSEIPESHGDNRPQGQG